MRRPSLWLALGVALGTAISDSTVALFVGLGIALAPWIGLAALHGVTRLADWWTPNPLWHEIEEYRCVGELTKRPAPIRPSPMEGERG